jgi:hypothetical protein
MNIKKEIETIPALDSKIKSKLREEIDKIIPDLKSKGKLDKNLDETQIQAIIEELSKLDGLKTEVNHIITQKKKEDDF